MNKNNCNESSEIDVTLKFNDQEEANDFKLMLGLGIVELVVVSENPEFQKKSKKFFDLYVSTYAQIDKALSEHRSEYAKTEYS